jgi:hypothetical protein
MKNLRMGESLIAPIKAAATSPTAFEVGMFGWMALDCLVFFADQSPETNTALYRASMQIAMIVGFATSYPANWWLVRSASKEVM